MFIIVSYYTAVIRKNSVNQKKKKVTYPNLGTIPLNSIIRLTSIFSSSYDVRTFKLNRALVINYLDRVH